MLWVRFASMEEKVEVIKAKKNLRGGKEWIADDGKGEKDRVVDRKEGRKSREDFRVRVGYKCCG